MSRRLRRYFEARPIKVITDQPLKQILNKAQASGKLEKYSVELGAYNITYEPRNAIKGQVLADFLLEAPVGTPTEEFFRLPAGVQNKDDVEKWTLFTDGASNSKGSGAGLVLISPSGVEFTYALRLNFTSTNNEAEYEALLAGLRMARKMKVEDIDVKVNSKLVASQINGSYVASSTSMIKYLATTKECIAEFKSFAIQNIPRNLNQKADILRGKCYRGGGRRQLDDAHHTLSGRMSMAKRQGGKEGLENENKSVCPRERMHIGARSVVAKSIRQGYYLPTMHRDARNVTQKCDLCQVHAPVPRRTKTLMTSIMAPWPFYQWRMDILGPLPQASGKLKFVIVAIDYFTKWIESKPSARITRKDVKKFLWDNIMCRFGLPRIIVKDNGT
ncbi:reverse transcriptase domain-containing protein [Tanacetum coccineum]